MMLIKTRAPAHQVALSNMLLAADERASPSALTLALTVRTYERLGAQAIFLEDQVSPKRCGHLAGKRIVPVERMVTKVRAAALGVSEAGRSG